MGLMITDCCGITALAHGKKLLTDTGAKKANGYVDIIHPKWTHLVKSPNLGGDMPAVPKIIDRIITFV